MVRGKTNQEDYRWLQNRRNPQINPDPKKGKIPLIEFLRVGKAYTIRRDSFGSYCKVEAHINATS